ncbi:hypothetical protein [Teredinibacter haidensis]|uniref:hypothetical protein n=1 Tax=Teredinibacter haidensis TaxID=2731755 RepID=UPI000948ED9F|nr:hypothetical protein [Teredinibacter haidensis]
MKTLLAFITGIGIVLSAAAQEGEVCPLINCDCSSLPSDSWKQTCRTHEQVIKERCAVNGNTPTDFCSLHGPSASPLPLAMKFSDMEVLAEEGLEDTHKETVALYLAIRSDLSSVKVKLSNLQFKNAVVMVKDIDNNVDSLFSAQRQLTMSWLVYEQEKEAVAGWRTYAEESLAMAEDQFAFGAQLWTQYQAADHEGKKKAYKVLALKLMRIAGKSFEVAGYSYAGGDRSKDAAKAWARGAEVSKALMVAKQESGADISHVNFYRYQAASRLHRASYYWAVDQKVEDALAALTLANEISPATELVELLANDDAQEESGVIQLVQ